MGQSSDAAGSGLAGDRHRLADVADGDAFVLVGPDRMVALADRAGVEVARSIRELLADAAQAIGAKRNGKRRSHAIRARNAGPGDIMVLVRKRREQQRIRACP